MLQPHVLHVWSAVGCRPRKRSLPKATIHFFAKGAFHRGARVVLGAKIRCSMVIPWSLLAGASTAPYRIRAYNRGSALETELNIWSALGAIQCSTRHIYDGVSYMCLTQASVAWNFVISYVRIFHHDGLRKNLRFGEKACLDLFERGF